MESVVLTEEQLTYYDKLLERGLSKGLGCRNGAMCIEAVWCTVLGLPHGDDPGCVLRVLRTLKINLNDKNWSSSLARAKGLRDLGIAQIGSIGLNTGIFLNKLTSKLISKLIVHLFQTHFPTIAPELVHSLSINPNTIDCRKLATYTTTAANVASVATAANAATYAATAATYAAIYTAIYASYADTAAVACTNTATACANADDCYLIMLADIAVEVLQEMNAPGCKYLKEKA